MCCEGDAALVVVCRVCDNVCVCERENECVDACICQCFGPVFDYYLRM